MEVKPVNSTGQINAPVSTPPAPSQPGPASGASQDEPSNTPPASVNTTDKGLPSGSARPSGIQLPGSGTATGEEVGYGSHGSQGSGGARTHST